MTNRKLVVVVAVVVLFAAGAVVAVVVLGRGSPPVAKTCDIPGSVPEQPVPAESAPGGGGIEVAEQGFTQAFEVRMGAVLRNTSDRIAYRTKVSFALGGYKEGGAPGGPPEGSVMTTEIPVMLPGQRVGVGRAIIVTGRVTAIAVNRHTTTWLPAGALGGGYVPASAGYTATIRHPGPRPNDAIRYAEDSASCRALVNRGTTVLFRDAGGKIVGGDLGFPDGRGNQVDGEQPSSSPSCSPGRRDTWIAPPSGAPPLGPPSTVDDRRTELYSYCDLDAPPSDVNKPF